MLPTELWVPEQPTTEALSPDQLPTQARMTIPPYKPRPKPAESKPVPATRFDTWINAVALISSGVVIAAVILLVGLAV
jgi:hypothetical protein